MNAVEVYCRIERDHGRARADGVMRSMRRLFDLDLPGPALMHRLPLLTGDPEILGQQDLQCAVEDLRPQPA